MLQLNKTSRFKKKTDENTPGLPFRSAFIVIFGGHRRYFLCVLADNSVEHVDHVVDGLQLILYLQLRITAYATN